MGIEEDVYKIMHGIPCEPDIYDNDNEFEFELHKPHRKNDIHIQPTRSINIKQDIETIKQDIKSMKKHIRKLEQKKSKHKVKVKNRK